jgi:hypothetical protein
MAKTIIFLEIVVAQLTKAVINHQGSIVSPSPGMLGFTGFGRVTKTSIKSVVYHGLV